MASESIERDQRCTCGSGGHPRQCALHPESYRLHVAELNMLALADEDDSEHAREVVDEFDAAYRAARAVRNETIAKLRAELASVRERMDTRETKPKGWSCPYCGTLMLVSMMQGDKLKCPGCDNLFQMEITRRA